MLMLILMTLTLIQSHSGSAKANFSVESFRQLSKQQQALNLIATMVGHCSCDLDFRNIFMDCSPCCFFVFTMYHLNTVHPYFLRSSVSSPPSHLSTSLLVAPNNGHCLYTYTLFTFMRELGMSNQQHA